MSYCCGLMFARPRVAARHRINRTPIGTTSHTFIIIIIIICSMGLLLVAQSWETWKPCVWISSATRWNPSPFSPLRRDQTADYIQRYLKAIRQHSGFCTGLNWAGSFVWVHDLVEFHTTIQLFYQQKSLQGEGTFWNGSSENDFSAHFVHTDTVCQMEAKQNGLFSRFECSPCCSDKMYP